MHYLADETVIITTSYIFKIKIKKIEDLCPDSLLTRYVYKIVVCVSVNKAAQEFGLRRISPVRSPKVRNRIMETKT